MVSTDLDVKELSPPDFAPGIEPWEKQPEESGLEFKAFEHYLHLPPEKRTVRDAYRKFNGMEPDEHITRGAEANWYRWSNWWRWRERVNAYDRWVNKQIEERLIMRRAQARAETAELGRVMKLKALEAVQAMNAVIYVENDKGEVVPKSSLSPNEIARLAQIGADLERDALGDYESSSGPEVAVQVNIQNLQARAREILQQREDVEIITQELLED